MLKCTSTNHFFSVHANTTFRFTNRNEFSKIGTKGVHVNNEWRLQKAKAESRTFWTISTAGHVREKEDGNPFYSAFSYYSAFSTEQEPASLASKEGRLTLYSSYGRVENMRDIFSRQKIHKSLVSGGYEGGKHGNSKILQVFY